MTFQRLVVPAILAVVAIGCNSDSRSHIPKDLTTGVAANRPGPATIVGCLQKNDRDGSYRLDATADTPDRKGRGISTAATSGRGAPPSSSTTGVGGDSVADSPTIGSGAIPTAYRIVPEEATAATLDQQIGAQVSVSGAIEDSATAGGSMPETHVIRAQSITRVADRCSGK